MSPFLRGTLFGVGLAGAFVAGYLVKHPPRPAKAAAETPFASQKPPVTSAPTEKPAPAIMMPDPPPSNLALGPAPIIDFDKLPPPAVKDMPIDPNDLAFQIIKKQLGIKTTVLEDSQPLPFPMTGPPPRLAPPPAIYPQPQFMPVKQVTSRAISLDFEMTRLGVGKVMAVELWTTRDGGATWDRTDRMDGCLSPFQTRLWSEGIYGFRLVFESETGVKTPTPKAGDLPELAIELVPLSHRSEPTLPEGKLTGVRTEDDGPEMGPMPRTIGQSPAFSLRVSQGKTESRVLVVTCSLPNIHPDAAEIDRLLNARLVCKLGELLNQKSVRLSAVPAVEFDDFKHKHENWKATHPFDIGRAIGPDVAFVIDVEIQELALNNAEKVFRAKTELVVNVYDLSKPVRDAAFHAELTVELNADEIDVESARNFAKLKTKLAEKIAREVIGQLVAEQINRRAAEREPEAGPVPRLVIDASAPTQSLNVPNLRFGGWGISNDDVGVVAGMRHHFVETVPSIRAERARLAEFTNGYTSDKSLMNLLRNTDWKPSTATPESYRTWQYERAKPSYFWGSYPGPAGIEFVW